MLLRLLPILLLVLYGFAMWHFSTWQLKRQLNGNSRRLRDSKLEPYLDRLAAALEVSEIPVHVYQIEPVNGLAAPDGRVFITEGFMRKYRAGEVSPEELTSVIAHELGHVALGHSRRRMIDFSGQNALRAVLMTVLGRFIPFIGPWIANLITAALAARLSQRDEFEADEFASALMIKAGFGTEPQVTLFHKLDALTKNAGQTTPAWLLTHPKTEKRIAAIEANQLRWSRAEH